MMRRWASKTGMKQAADWFSRTLSGTFDLKSDRAWKSWMEAGDGNRDAFEKLGTSWEIASLVEDRPRVQSLLREVDDRIRARASARQTAARRWPWRPLATGVACLVLALSFFFAWTRDPVTSATSYATAIGEQRVVTLEDRSSVSLNTGTSIRVVYRRKSRQVELLNGEAVFSVTSNPERPFSVHALQGSSVAVGTQYAVQIAAPDSVVVSVLEGVVDVHPARERGGNATRLSAGSAVSYTSRGEISGIRRAEVDRIRGWQAQRLVFNDLALADAVAEFNRYRNIPVVLGNEGLAARRISGVYRIGEEDAFLNALQQLYRLRVTRSDTQIVLQPTGKGQPP